MTPQPEPHDDLDVGLRAAFGDVAAPSTPSVLRLLQQKTGSKLDLHLDAKDEGGLPVRIDEAAKELRDPSGRYQVLGEIGRGGVGIVYKGRDQDLGRDVAMKVLRAEYASRPEILERFVEEAQIGGQLQHPGIVPVYELGLQAGERPYFAMKLVKGDTLATLLDRRNSPSDDRHRFLAIFAQICQTLAYAHARRVVHRDLKPVNVMIGSFGEVQVVDWGLAKVLQRQESRRGEPAAKPVTASVIATHRSDPRRGAQSVVGSTMGTPAYMPPEQALGDVTNLDERSDVFGLGGILCEILTGEPPYLERDGDLLMQAARCDLTGVHQRLDRCGADDGLIALCKRCLAPSRLARPASGKELADAIEAHLASVEQRAHEAEIRAAEARVRARSTLLLASTLLGVVVLGGAAAWFYNAEAQQRREQADQRVASALQQTSEQLGAARSAATNDRVAWTRALDSARQAEVLGGDAAVSPEQRTAVKELLATVAREHDRAEATAARAAADATMQQRLRDARMTLQEFAMRTLPAVDQGRARELVAKRYDETYGSAFRDHLGGRDVQTMPREEAVLALQGPLAVELAAALDHWATKPTHFLATGEQRIGERARHLQSIAMALDPDPWRNRMRALLTSTSLDPAAVRRLFADTDLATLPAVSVQMLTMALHAVGEYRTVLQMLEQACDQRPTDAALAFDLGTMYVAAGQLARAETHLRTTRSLLPNSALAHHNLSFVQHSLGQFAAAVTSSRRAMELDPANPTILNHFGNLLVQMGKTDEGMVPLRRAIAIDPEFAMPWNSLGVALLGEDENDEAARCFQEAIRLAPKFADAHHNLGDARIAQNRTEDAIACYREALAHAPNDLITLNNLSLALDRIGQIDEAMKHLRRALELDPKNGPSNLNLGRLLDRSGRLEEAIGYWRRAEATWRSANDEFGRRWHGKVQTTLAEAESKLEAHNARLALARGERQSQDAQELLAAAALMAQRSEHALAVRLYERAFATDAGLRATASHRLDAAQSAAQAGCGLGVDAAALPREERTRLRELARQWFAEELARWRQQLATGGDDAAAARRAAELAMNTTALAGVRDETALAALPATEATAWRALWAELAGLLRA